MAINPWRKPVAHYANPQNRLIGMNRRNGYVHALEKYGIAVDKEFIIDCDTYEQARDITITGFGDSLYARVTVPKHNKHSHGQKATLKMFLLVTLFLTSIIPNAAKLQTKLKVKRN